MSEDDRHPDKPRDVLFVHSKSDNGDVNVVRKRDERIEIGRMRPVVEGKPLSGEVVRLERRAEHERLFDVEVVYDGRATEQGGGRATSDGPPQVASPAYRENWARIFADGDSKETRRALQTSATGRKNVLN